MPFVYLKNNHQCQLPKLRDDGTKLQYGDIWECDNKSCGLRYTWSNDIIDDYHWKIARDIFDYWRYTPKFPMLGDR